MSFRAYATSNQWLASVTGTQLKFQAEDFDSNSNFCLNGDTGCTKNSFTPTVAGKYILTATVATSSMASGYSLEAMIYKNGSAIAYGTYNYQGAAGAQYSTVVVIADANGTTDYFEAYGYNSYTSSINTAGNHNSVYFSGALIGGGGGGSGDDLGDHTATQDLDMASHNITNVGTIGAGIDALNNVDTTGVADGDCLVYNNTSGKWEDGACGGGSSFTCPSGFTLLQKNGQTLGCMQDTPNAATSCLTAIGACWTNYGGRLPSYPEIRIGVAEGVVAGSTLFWTGEASGSGSCGTVYVNDNPWGTPANGSAQYHCFIPASGGGGGATALSGLTDVDTTGVADGNCLVYNNGTSKWEDGACGGSDTLSGLSCSSGQIAKYNGSSWACAADDSGSGGGSCFWTPYTTAAPTGGTFNYPNSMASSTDGAKLAYTVNGDYIYTSTDGGANWTKRTNAGARSWYDIASSSDGTKLLAAEGGGDPGDLYLSTNSGSTWTLQSTGAGQQMWQAVALSADGTKRVAAYEGGKLRRYNGSSWSQLTNSGAYDWAGIDSSSDGTKLVAVEYSSGGTGGYIWTSADSGSTWTQRTAAGNRYWYHVASSADGMTIAAATYELSSIYISTDGGANWTPSDIGGEWYGLAMSDDGATILAMSAMNALAPGYGIFVSTDSGAT